MTSSWQHVVHNHRDHLVIVVAVAALVTVLAVGATDGRAAALPPATMPAAPPAVHPQPGAPPRPLLIDAAVETTPSGDQGFACGRSRTAAQRTIDEPASCTSGQPGAEQLALQRGGMLQGVALRADHLLGVTCGWFERCRSHRPFRLFSQTPGPAAGASR